MLDAIKADRSITKSEVRLQIVLFLLIAALAIPSANAVDPDRRISQYAHTAWRVRDGVFAGAPTAITQTTDGYIWIGTRAGLLRFDGVHFVLFTLPPGKRLPNPAIISLLGAKDGSLWIGTASGLAQWKNGDLINFPETVGRVNSIYEDREGTIWMGRSRKTDLGGICKIASPQATCYAPSEGAPAFAETVIGDNLGYLWIGAGNALVRWKPGSLTSYELPGLKSRIGLHGVGAVALAPDGSVWIGISQSGRGLGLQQWVNDSWKALITPTFDSSTLNVNDLWLDRHNALWIATEGTGIYRVHDGKVDRFRGADGLSGDSAGSFFEDREGNLWVTTPDGVDCFHDIPVVNFSVHEGLSSDHASSVFAAGNGTIWIGTHGLDYVRGDIVSSIGPRDGLPGNRVTSLFEDRTGQLWVGVDNGLFIYDHGRFKPVQRPDGGLIGIVVAMAEDRDSQIWAVVIRNPPGVQKLVRIRDGKIVEEISDPRLRAFSLADDQQGGLWLGLNPGLARYRNGQFLVFPLNAGSAVTQVLANSDGSVLAATTGGLVERRSETQHTLNDQNGLPCSRIFAIVADKHSNLWLYAECGLIEIKSSELQGWREHPDAKIKFDLFDRYDGAQPYFPPFTPVAARSNDGRLWFANETVVQMVDPDRLSRNSIPPPVHIEEVIADRKNYSPRSGLRLPARTRDLEIDYTALSFVVPQKMQFRYKLEGYDQDWQDPKTRRQAFYSNLRPGNYRFRVMASNNSGVWNEGGASLDFNIAPAYYQTKWFLFLCAAMGLGFLYFLHKLRSHQLTQQFRVRMEERVNERTRIARELHDSMLQGFQGLMFRLQAVRDMLPGRAPLEAIEALDIALDRGDKAIAEGRDTVADLRQSLAGDSDIAEALKTLSTDLAAQTGKAAAPCVRVLVEGRQRQLNPTLRVEVYRIGCEALRNAFHHAKAQKVEAEITYGDSEFLLHVRDDGIGIAPEVANRGTRAGHWGLPGMRERAKSFGGKLEVWSEHGAGTEIELIVPAAIAYGKSGARPGFRFWRKEAEETNGQQS